MSKFLAPIHTWLFNKVKLYENLELDLVKSYVDKYGKDVEDSYKNLQQKYGCPLEDRGLEDLIDVSNIHGWLQHRISIAETRQAALITEILNKYDKDQALNIAFNVYNRQANNCAENAKQEHEVTTATKIFDTLNNYIIEGMPCDRVSTIIENTEDKLQWETSSCLHKDYWKAVSGDINIFYKLRSSWVKTFVESVNNDFTYNVSYNAPETTPIAIHEVKRK